jgi:hypothetical protein
MDKEILKTAEGLVQIVKCPRCLYMVAETDIVWTRQPNDCREKGEAKCCRFDEAAASSLTGETEGAEGVKSSEHSTDKAR